MHGCDVQTQALMLLQVMVEGGRAKRRKGKNEGRLKSELNLCSQQQNAETAAENVHQ